VNGTRESHRREEASVATWDANRGTLAGPNFGNYQAGFRFGKLGYELMRAVRAAGGCL
jgi:hypothetical protein